MLTLVCCKIVCIKVVLNTMSSIMIEKAEISIKLGLKIKEIRNKKSLSQEQLAHLADVHRTYIGMIERAEKNITLVNAYKIAKALEIDLVELLK